MIDKIINLINPENKDLQKMSKDELLELLIKLNKCLRCLDNSENVIAGAMEAGNLVSPTKEVQTKILEYLCENLSKVQDDKVRAAMVYYILLDLHIFNDGNGRTARFMYDLISGDLSVDRIPYYFHKDSNIVKDSQNDLEESKGILDVSYVDQIPDEIIGQQLRFIPTSILEDYFWITVGYTDSSPSTKSIIPKSVLEQLSEQEIKDLNQILHDGYGMKLCPSGIAILYVSKRKGQLSTWIDKNTTNLAQGIGLQGRLNFSIYRNTEMIADWTVDDFREVIRVGNTVKYARLKCLIDIFVEPEKYININSGKPYLNEIISNPSEKKVFD